MIKRNDVLSIVACSCALAGCGGGGDGAAATAPVSPPVSSTAPAPTPAPSPAPAPAPPPTPTPTYASFDQLSGDQTYAGNCASYFASSENMPTGSDSSFFNRAGPVRYIAATQTYTVAVNSATRSYSPVDRVSGTSPGVTAFAKTTGRDADRFEIAQPSASGVELDYARQGYSLNTTPSFFAGQTDRRVAYCIIGNPPLTTDIPTASIVTFPRLTVRGEAYVRNTGSVVGYTLGKSTATMTVDLTTGRLQTVVRLIGTPTAGSDVELGTYDVGASLNVDTAGFSGGTSPIPGTASFAIDGGFFGPQGKEFGYVFRRFEGATGVIRNTDVTIVGVVFGAR